MNNKVVVSIDNLIPLIKESFQKQQDVSITVKGTSMEPFFHSGKTEVTLSPFDGTLTKYNVYLYKVKDTYLLHRYIKTKDDKHFFRGDALRSFEVVQIEDIIGVVKEMKSREHTISSDNSFYLLRVKIFLCMKSIKLRLRRIIKGQ